ncbi:MAG: homoaconitate hydratase family protein [bacterium]|nr:homoaconitate hydratase family protein [bacterium]
MSEGRVLELGDDVNTDDIIPARRCTSADPEHLARYAFEHLLGEGALAAGFDEIEAGRNFGCGSSREHAPLALKSAGIERVRARSFAEIFFRNSVNIGLPLKTKQEGEATPLVAAIVGAGGLTAFNQSRRTGGEFLAANGTGPRPMTLAEKILARASGNRFVAPGETVFVGVDLAMSHDAVAGPVARQFHAAFGPEARVWSPSQVVFVADHFIQVNDVRKDEGALKLHRDMVHFAREQGCQLFDVVGEGEAAGICHVLLPEQGLVGPGMVIAGTDSHTCTYGAFGCFSFGVGTTDMANLLAMGDVWVRVPPTLRVELRGQLPEGCCAKDLALFLLGQLGCDGASGKVLEFRGPGLDALPMEERMTLANMAVESGAVCGLMAPDAVTRSWLQARAPQGWQALEGDPDAESEDSIEIDLRILEPQVACPPSPDQVTSVTRLGHVPITRAFIGSCTGGKLHDLAEAAAVLEGRRVASGVNLFVVPASQEVRREAERCGYLRAFEEAGATLLKSGCGACINAGRGTLPANENGVYATSRNFRGRSGDPSGQVYLASPRVVANSAVMGHISDRLDD